MTQISSAEWWRPAVPLAGGLPPAGALRPGYETPDRPLAFRALLTFLLIMLTSPQSFVPALARLRIALLAAAVAIAAHLFDRYRQRRPATLRTREMGITALLVGWAVLSVPLSYWPGGSLGFLLDFYLKTVAIFWLLCNTVSTRSRLRQVAWGLTLMGVPLAATAVANFLGGAFLAAGSGTTRIVGYESSLGRNPNDLALTLNLILPLSVALLALATRAAVRWLLVAVVVLYVAGVAVTFSRGGFLTLATLFLVYMVRLVRGGRPGWALTGLAAGLLSLTFLPAGYLARLATIADIDSDPTGSAQERRSDTLGAIRSVASHPVLGAGVGMNVLALNEARGVTWRAVHNAYLEYAVELGLPGLALFLLLLKACLGKTRDVARDAARVPGLLDLVHLAGALRASLLAFAVAAVFHPVAYHFYFYLVAGLAVAAGAIYRSELRQRGLAVAA
jgi:O-antigen ligase